MAKWYHHASWTLLRELCSPSLIKNHPVEARGLERLPEPPFVLMADHANALDPYILGTFARSPIRYMANVEGVHPLKGALRRARRGLWQAQGRERHGRSPRNLRARAIGRRDRHLPRGRSVLGRKLLGDQARRRQARQAARRAAGPRKAAGQLLVASSLGRRIQAGPMERRLRGLRCRRARAHARRTGRGHNRRGDSQG